MTYRIVFILPYFKSLGFLLTSQMYSKYELLWNRLQHFLQQTNYTLTLSYCLSRSREASLLPLVSLPKSFSVVCKSFPLASSSSPISPLAELSSGRFPFSLLIWSVLSRTLSFAFPMLDIQSKRPSILFLLSSSRSTAAA